jgi:thioredoxin 1
MDAKHRKTWRWPLILTMIFALSCGESGPSQSRPADGKQKAASLSTVENQAEFNRIIASAGERLLLFDVYADWCPPCKELEPILESIAQSNHRNVDIYKINLDENPYLFDLFQVRGIPLVVFVRNQTVVYSLMGLRPKEAYLEAIQSFSRS